MTFRAPKTFAHKRISENVSTIDLLPTFAQLAGAPIMLPLDGISLVPYLTGDKANSLMPYRVNICAKARRRQWL